MTFPYLAPTIDVGVNYTIEAAKTPYMDAFFQANKNVGENRHQFAKRMIMQQARKWWAEQALEAEREANNTAFQTFKQEANDFTNQP